MNGLYLYLSGKLKPWLFTVALMLATLFFIGYGCISGKTAKNADSSVYSEADIKGPGPGYDARLSETGTKAITKIAVEEDEQSLDLLVYGNRQLGFTTVERPFPRALILYFTDTRLIADQKRLLESGRLVGPVVASETREETTGTKIEIRIQEPTPFEIIEGDKMLRVAFSKGQEGYPAQGEERDIRATRPYPKPNPKPVNLDAHSATRLHSVYATKMEDGLKVFVGADGMITNYKTFTIESPPRIVFDIFNVESPYKNEKQVPVNTSWVSRVRYRGYEDRLRVVLDTKSQFLDRFNAYPANNGLLIHVGGEAGYDRSFAIAGAGKKAPVQADEILSVYSTRKADGIRINVRTNGEVRSYTTSVTETPPAIVVDIAGVRPNERITKSFPVDSQWVKRITHEAYPGGTRILIHTYKQYLSHFEAQASGNGLMVHVGDQYRAPDFSEKVQVAQGGQGYTVTSSAHTPGESLTEQTADPGHPAWVNQIDFVSEPAGKSSLLIGTTQKVGYDLVRKGDKELELRLYNTKIPDFRQRQLITDRFESAVDVIMPDQKPKEKNLAAFRINLREAVPHYVEQTGNMLQIHFEASSVPPKPVFGEEPVLAGKTPPGNMPDQTQLSGGTDSQASVPSVAADIEMQEDMQGIMDMPAPPSAPEQASASSVPPGQETGPQGAALATAEPEPALSESDMLMRELLNDELFEQVDESQYTGEKIALDFFNTDIRNVFRILREVSGKNIAIDKDVNGRVTLTLEHPVPWDQVLDLVLKMNNLGKIWEGDILRIVTLNTLNQEKRRREAERDKLLSRKKKEKELEPLITEYIPINYAKVSDIQKHLEKIKTDKRGKISVDTRTHMIIMTDTEDTIKRAKEIVRRLDKVTPQVIIEAKIIEATQDFEKQLGAELGVLTGIQGDSTDAGIGPQRGYDLLGGTYGLDMAINLMPTSRTGAIGFNFTRIAGTNLILNATLAAMESRGSGKVISSPRILTMDNKAANITQGYQIPYKKTDDDGNTTTEWKDIDLTLDVTPKVTPDNRISLQIDISKQDPLSQTEDGMSTSNKSAKTELLINDGDTVIIGGIISTNETLSKSAVPALGNIPLLGWLFKSKSSKLQKNELMIFITPRIVQLEQREVSSM